MSTVQISDSSKKGGPYTKQQTDERRRKVYTLYFEKAIPAVRIAESLNVNRNTINEDIKFWLSQLVEETGNNYFVSKALQQLHSLELQKSRLYDELEKREKLDERLAIERLILDIDTRLTQFVGKIIVGTIGSWIQGLPKDEKFFQ
jgi:predicted DNA-binding protein YlxM (UPF0122 family)